MAIPEYMGAVTTRGFGGPEVVTLGRERVPVPGAGQALVRVAYAGVGQWDPAEREGLLPEITGEHPDFPLTLGGDGSGTVAVVGPGVDRFAEGDRVYGLGGGFYAEYVLADARALAPVPRGLGLDEAGAMPIVALTAWQGLVEELRVASGDVVLINGASGDAGHLAVQLATRLGARVVAVASGEDGAAAVRELGAEVAIDGRTADVAAAARDVAPAGVDAVLSFVGGASFAAAASTARPGATVAYPLGVEPAGEPPAGVGTRAFDLTLDSPQTTGRKLAGLSELIVADPVRVLVSATFPLAEVRQAHDALAKHRVGKVILVVRP